MSEALHPYAAALRDIGIAHPEVVVIDLGLGTSMQTAAFQEAFPDRYFNLGIAEQNGVGLASGLARRGLIPLVHSFSNFIARRAHDQVAVSVAWPGCNVKLVAGTVGVFDGRNGPSHMAVDDLAAMSALPGMTVIEPADQQQTRELLFRAVRTQGPVYFRLHRHSTPASLIRRLGAEGTAVVSEAAGSVCTVVAAGTMLGEALQAERILADRGVPIDLIHVAVLRPLKLGPIAASACRTGRVVVIENHGPVGGFGSAVALALGPSGARIHCFALPDDYIPAGDPAWQLRFCGLDAASLADRIQTMVDEEEPC